MKYLILYFCFSTSIGFTQKQAIDIVEKRSASQIMLYAINNSTEEVEMDFDLTLSGFTTNEKLPMNVNLKPNIERYLVTLTAPKGVQCEYSTSVSYKKAKKQTTKTSGSTKDTKYTGIQLNPTKINVFTIEGCVRCEQVIKYLDEHKIPYLELNTTYHLPNNDLMFEKLREAGFKGENVQMPVVIQHDKTYFNINNIPDFLKKIKIQ